MEAFQVIDALLDVLDATGTVVALMAVWYTWVMPPRISPEQAAAMELEHFLRAAAAGAPARAGLLRPTIITSQATSRSSKPAGRSLTP
jgi:hypothetical protein